MPSFLEDPEASFCLEGQMRSGIPGAKALLEQPPTPESIQGGGRLVPLLGSIRNYSQRGLNKGGEQNTTPGVLHQLGLSRS